MGIKHDLVLDIAGVIATNFSPIFWEALSSIFEVSHVDLITFRTEVREQLWTGQMKEHEFWDRLVERFPTVDGRYAANLLLSVIKPLPALLEIPSWSKHANIHLLSNHRIEWVKHIIKPVEGYVKSITISGEVGFCKPQPEIYLS
ncbi:hypothetical protein ACFSCX_11630 [Bacillus salitolerans]|uniref:Haloacid dehalogenase n=1 Tax=Bacillus salitolerans TaxID=1437434 RepID=A0ABW4LRQ7_9BACI